MGRRLWLGGMHIQPSLPNGLCTFDPGQATASVQDDRERETEEREGQNRVVGHGGIRAVSDPTERCRIRAVQVRSVVIELRLGVNRGHRELEANIVFCRLAAALAVRCFGAATSTIALGGGCMVNRLLQKYLAAALQDDELNALIPQQLPPGDGGLAYGQAVLAAASLQRGACQQNEGET